MTGRMQRLELPEGPCILDVAHNPEAATTWPAKLEQWELSGQVHLVIGMLCDKDSEQVIRHLQAQIGRWYPVTLGGPRGTEAVRLANTVRRLGGTVADCYPGVEQGLAAARAAMKPGDLLLVAGSFLTVTAALKVAGTGTLNHGYWAKKADHWRLCPGNCRGRPVPAAA